MNTHFSIETSYTGRVKVSVRDLLRQTGMSGGQAFNLVKEARARHVVDGMIDLDFETEPIRIVRIGSYVLYVYREGGLAEIKERYSLTIWECGCYLNRDSCDRHKATATWAEARWEEAL